MTATSLHDSGWFTYATREDKPRGETLYKDCVLLQDLDYDRDCNIATLALPAVTFHQDAQCRAGARLPVIAQLGRQLAGWATDGGDGLVMDLYY